MKRLQKDSLLADRSAVEQMLTRLPQGDVLGRASFDSRLSEINSELASIHDAIDTAGSIALMFGGTPVHGSRAIDAEFSTSILKNFQALVTKRIALEEFGSLGRSGPIPNATEVNLSITEMVRGSVGFLIEENARNLQIADSAVKHAIENVAELVTMTASEQDSDFESIIDTLDPRLIVSLRDFFRTLDNHGATIRLVEDSLDETLNSAAVHRGRLRVDTTEIEDSESENVVGVLLGLMPDAKKFEMRLEGSADIVRGTVAAAYAARYLELIEGQHSDLVGRKWRTRMKVREVKERNKPPRFLYTLIGLLEQIDGDAAT